MPEVNSFYSARMSPFPIQTLDERVQMMRLKHEFQYLDLCEGDVVLYVPVSVLAGNGVYVLNFDGENRLYCVSQNFGEDRCKIVGGDWLHSTRLKPASLEPKLVGRVIMKCRWVATDFVTREREAA